MNKMLPRDYQLMLEHKYSKSNIRKYILKDIIETKELMDKLHVCVVSISEWAEQEHYTSKYESLAIIREMSEEELQNLLIDMLSVLLTQSYSMELTSAVGLVSSFIPWKDYKEAIKRASELIYHLAAADILDMTPAYASSSETILITNKYALSGDTAKYIEQTKFTPPMVCVPEPVKSTRDSGYLTKQNFALLKGKHQHSYPVNLAAINKFNSIPLSLDIDFLKEVEDEIKIDTDSAVALDKQQQAFDKLRVSTYETCIDVITAGNVFYETHFWCGRGRTYSRGYHINSQGNSYRKAMVNCAEPASINEDLSTWEGFF